MNENQNNKQLINNEVNCHLIQLYGKNPSASSSIALVSKNKSQLVSQYKWYLGKDNYPFAFMDGARVPLHRFIWYINTNKWDNYFIEESQGIMYKKKLYIDHINRNKLDATDENLRLATPASNSYNRTSKSNIIDPITLSPLHHIKFKKSGYEVKINKSGKTHCINKIASLEESKNIYNMMATELFGDYAVLYD
jgi:hypothetical protein